MKLLLLSLSIIFSFAICSSFASEIKGRVTDKAGEALAGASVYLESTSKGAITDKNGNFTINNVKKGRYFLSVSILGYKSEKNEISVNESADLTINFTLDQIALQLGEVMVSADKREGSLQKTPIAISAITADGIQDHSIRQRTDLSAISPNTLIAETGSHMTDFINIRGISPSTPFATTTLFYVDGVPIFGYGQNPMYLNDIERIEILRGPQGTLYGRNALAGVINITTKKPNNMFSVNGSIDYGNFSSATVNLGASVPLIKDVLFARLSGFYYDKNGYFTNTTLNNNAGGSKGYGGTFNLRFYPSENFSAELFASNEYIDESIWPFAWDPQTAMSDQYKITRNLNSEITKNNLISSLKLTYRTSLFNIVSTTSYLGISHFNWNYDADFSAADAISFEERTPTYDISDELRFESANSLSPLKWTAGLFYNYENNKDDYRVILHQDYKIYGIISLPFAPLDNPTQGTRTTSNWAVFGQFDYSFFNNFTLTAGLRYEKQIIDVNTVTWWEYNGSPVPKTGIPPIDDTFGAIDTNKNNKSFGFVCPKIALSYQIDKENMVYLSASRGYHGGDFNSGANKQVPYYEPESTWNYELGYKTTLLNDKLRINSSLFYIDWTNQQVLAIGDLSNPLNTITNAGKTVSKGFELEFQAIPAQGLSLNGSFGFLDAHFVDFKFNDVGQNGQDTTYNFSGNKLSFAPRLNTDLSAKYEMPFILFSHPHVFGIEIDYQHLESYYMSHVNKFESLPRNLINLRAGVFTKSIDIYFWCKNLLNFRYIYATYEYRGGEQALLGAPRTLGLTLNLRW